IEIFGDESLVHLPLTRSSFQVVAIGFPSSSQQIPSVRRHAAFLLCPPGHEPLSATSNQMQHNCWRFRYELNSSERIKAEEPSFPSLLPMNWRLPEESR